MKAFSLLIPALVALALSFIACDSKGGGAGSPSSPASEATSVAYSTENGFSVKYAKGSETYIFTAADDKNIRRLDVFEKDGTHNIYIRKYVNGQMSGMRYENGRWEDSLSAVQTIGSFNVWSSLHLYYKDAGFTRTGETKIAGQNCRVWTGTQGKMNVRYSELELDQPAEISVWDNNVTMRLKSGNKVMLEAVAVSVDIPDTAFTETVDVTWIR